MVTYRIAYSFLFLAMSTIGWACSSDGPRGGVAGEDAAIGVDASAMRDAARAGDGDPSSDDASTSEDNDGGTDAATPGEISYGDLPIKPDAPTTKVASCAGQPDFTLCDVVTTPDRWYDVCIDQECVSPGCGSRTCNTSGPHFLVPPTRDHHYFSKVEQDEPITIDLVTGLHWQACPGGVSAALCEQGAAVNLGMTDAAAYCDALLWGGHDDWYLPDIYELLTLADFALAGPNHGYQNDAFFPPRADVKDSMFWSSTATKSSNSGFLFYTQMSLTWSDIADEEHGVRCVRRGFSTPWPSLERFVADGSWKTKDSQATVEDRVTKLTWQACPTLPGESDCTGEARGTTAGEAKVHCASLTWAGFSDWRLASWKEVQSLMNLTKVTGSAELLDTTLFRKGGGPAFNYVLSADGLVGVRDAELVGIGVPTAAYPTYCVRGPVL